MINDFLLLLLPNLILYSSLLDSLSSSERQHRCHDTHTGQAARARSDGMPCRATVRQPEHAHCQILHIISSNERDTLGSTMLTFHAVTDSGTLKWPDRRQLFLTVQVDLLCANHTNSPQVSAIPHNVHHRRCLAMSLLFTKSCTQNCRLIYPIQRRS